MTEKSPMARQQKQPAVTAKRHHLVILFAALILAVLVSWRPEVGQSKTPSSEGLTAARPVAELAESALQAATLVDTSTTAVTTPLIEVSAPAAPQPQYQTHSVRAGDNLFVLLQRAGVSAREIMQIVGLGADTNPLKQLRPGQTIELAQDDQGLVALRYAVNAIDTLQINRGEEDFIATLQAKETETRVEQATGTVTSSLFLAAQAADLADGLIIELAEIFAWDVDFNLDIRAGDQFTVVYEAVYHNDEKLEEGAIISAEFINKGTPYRAVRYQSPEGKIGYFDEDGHSVRKAFLRSPVKFSRISSRFNPNRLHPVLKTSRPHRGVDYAANRGTPIQATGDGKVIWAGTKGGYGRTVILRHGGRYSTLYAHMNSYAKNIKTGRHIKQGQTVGYVGSSGLATGPHLHYEFRLDGVHRNPLTVKFPEAEPVAPEFFDHFRHQTSPLFAQLDTIGRVNLAAQ
ncbi:MAG: peptidoglycan DD-metalloendopeptidase family protein [Gammaproteobacteria bacterium]|nr:peptidoglycan DD-metalloendopeptidase family protein [Gammaproteobacteria bacterium]